MAVVEYTNFTAIEADEHLQTANLSTEYRCPRELEAERALQQVTDCHATLVDAILIDNLNFLQYDGSFCNTSFDGLLCWPPTKIDTVLMQPCFSEFQGVQYDVSSELIN